MKFFLPFAMSMFFIVGGHSTDTLSYYIQSKNLSSLDAQYIEVLITAKPLSTRFFLEIDYGQETRFFSFRDRRLAHKSGEYVEFLSRIAAINHMVDLGYDIFDHQYIFDSNGNVCGQRLLMRKREAIDMYGQ